MLSFFAFAGSATADYVYRGTFSGPGAEPGQLETPGRAAVEQSTGNLFVVDSGNDRVQVFTPNPVGTASFLTSFGQGELSEPWGIAISEIGGQTSVYVADAGNGRIAKYDSDEAENPTFTLDASFESPSGGSGEGEVGSFKAGLAIDLTSGDLLLADYPNKLIQRFEADGTFVSAFDGSAGDGSPGAFTGPIDVAVNSAGDVYVVDANGPNIAAQEGTSIVLRFSADGGYKSTLGPVGTHERPATVAVNPVSDEVIVTGDQDAVYEGGPPPHVPALQLFSAENDPLPTPKLDKDALYDTVSGVAIAAEAEANRLYVVLDVGRYFGSPYGSPQIQAFEEPFPAAPQVLDQTVTPAYREALLAARIDPGNVSTEYHFEYGPTAAYGLTTATKTIPAGGDPVTVKAPVFGLEEGASYHFRVVATNSVATVEGTDQSFTTLTEAGAGAPCANEAIRQAQSSGFLPDCRAYEMVTPADKNGQDVGLPSSEVSNTAPATVAADGQRLTYLSSNAFPDANEGTRNLWFARRSASGWTAVSGNNQPGPASDLGYLVPQRPMGTSENQLAAGLDDRTTKANPAADRGSLWIVRADGSREQIVGSAPAPPANFKAISGDGHHVVFGSADHLVAIPGEPNTEGRELLYEWTDAGGSPQIRLVNVDGDGNLLGNGEANLGGMGAETSLTIYARHAISRDGSRIFFQTPPPNFEGMGGGPLYLREHGSETVDVSAPDPGHSAGANLRFLDATPDGSRVFFWSDGQLTDTAAPAGGVYRYDVESASLTWLTEAASAPMAMASEDGRRIYLGPAPEPSGDSRGEIRLNEEGVDKVVAPLVELGNALGRYSDSVDEFGPAANISPDGRFYSFITCDTSCEFGELKRYDAATGELLTAAYFLMINSPLPLGELGQRGNLARAMTVDGTIFFTTPTALVPEDANNRRDVYMWRPGETRLISRGTSQFDSSLSGVSASGDDVFFTTAERLVPRDGDTNFDIYNARVNGGFLEALAPPACIGEACQGAASAVPSLATPANLVGPGNRKHPRGNRRGCRKQPQRQAAASKKKPRCKRHAHKKKGGTR